MLRQLSTRGRLADGSDFLALLRLWDYLRESAESPVRQRVPAAVPRRVPALPAGPGVAGPARPAPADRPRTRAGPQRAARAARPRCTRAALTGLLSHVGLADLAERPVRAPADGRPAARRAPREYLGARGTRFAINPGSSVARIQPPLVMAAEIVETTRLWARTVGPITAEQVEEVGGHLLKRNYSEPHWSARAGSVMAYETVSLVRGADRRRPPGRLRQDQSGRGAGDLPPVGAGRGPVADPAPLLRRQPGRSGPRPRSWRSGPAAGTWSSTTRSSSASTTPGCPPTSPRWPTSTPGGRRPGTQTRICSP